MIRILLLAVLSCCYSFSLAQSPSEWHKLKAPVNIFVANDLGRNGYYDQRPIADLMGRMAEEIGPDAVIALGDVHHFNGVASTSDPLWLSNFENIYTHPELMIDWLPVLGNHEYRGNTGAVLDYGSVSRRWVMPARYYSRTFSGKKGTSVRLIMIDTTPLIDKYRNDSTSYPDASRQDVEAQLSWLQQQLADATEDWVIVAGHHPIFANTPKADSERTDMQRRVDAILRQHRVDMYICGHIHNFQHIRPEGSGTDYIVNSSGSLSRPKVNAAPGTVFVSGEPGFSVISASPDSLSLTMVNASGTPIHTVTRARH
ncbi:MAG: metallophosphoesterase [Muribaculaceae bacterium]|nr:metallophosphoesterase [Muribaculaceae bacterium]